MIQKTKQNKTKTMNRRSLALEPTGSQALEFQLFLVVVTAAVAVTGTRRLP